jgi:hypothetical protein
LRKLENYVPTEYVNIRAGDFDHIDQHPRAKICEEIDWLALG